MSIVMIDGHSIFDVSRKLSVKTNHQNIAKALIDDGVCQTIDQMIIFVGVDPKNEGQDRLVTALQKAGFIVNASDHRDHYLIPNGGHQRTRATSKISYLLGYFASPYDKHGDKRTPPHIVVISDDYGLHYPCLDYVETRGGSVTVSFFRSEIDDRFGHVVRGLSPIKYHDLSSRSRSIFGVDLSTIAQSPTLVGMHEIQL